MISYSYVDEYIRQWRDGEIILNKERIMLIEWLEADILTMGGVYFDSQHIEQCIQFCEKWYFVLDSFQTFITCFIFLRYNDTDDLVFDEFFIYMARGAGKNGFVSTLVNYLINELHGIYLYNVSIVANSEKQAKTSFTEVYNTIDTNDDLKGYFKHHKAVIESVDTKSIFQFHTSNASTKDGLRDGCVI